VAELVAGAERLTATQQAQAPMFLPYLNGERTPHNDATAKGVLFGMTPAHDAAHLAYAVMEGVAFAMADIWPCRLRALCWRVGGGRAVRSGRVVCHGAGDSLAATCGAEVGAALGAARLGRLAHTGRM
jgi:xylulokinase